MRDLISIQRVNQLHPKVKHEVIKGIELAEDKLGKKACIRVVQGLRTFEEQDNYFALGRTIVNPDGKTSKRPMGRTVTDAKAGQSYHNYGLAFDFAIMYDKDGNGTFETLSWDILKDMDIDGERDWMEVVNIFLNLGWKWGGNFSSRDNPHLEKTFGLNWRDMLYRRNIKRFIPNTTYIQV